MYRVININTGMMWEGEAKNAKEAYSHITINEGDTIILSYGKDFRLISVLDGQRNGRHKNNNKGRKNEKTLQNI